MTKADKQFIKEISVVLRKYHKSLSILRLAQLFNFTLGKEMGKYYPYKATKLKVRL